MAVAGDAKQQSIFPISELSTYQQRWTIRARVTSKSQLRTFSKGSNTGKVFHVHLLDAAGGEIRASFFNEAVDQHNEKLQTGKCYTFSRGSIKVANRQFNPCNHRYELTFDRNADVIEVADDAQIETVKLSITDIRSVQSRSLPCTVDLCGIVTNFGQSQSFTSRDGKELVKREVTIADDTATSLQVTLWGERAKQDDSVFEGHSVIGLKGVAIKEWNGGRSGSLLEGGQLVLKPSFPEAQKLQQWWSQGGSSQTLTALSQAGSGGGGRALNAKAVTLAEMRRSAEIVADRPEHYTVTCRLALVSTRNKGEPQPLHYIACQEPKEGNGFPCNRRVDSGGFCAACNRAGKTAPRLNLRCRFADFADSAWITTFHEAAQQVLGMKAEKVQELENDNTGREGIEAAIGSTYFDQPLQLTLRAKLDTYNGEPRPNITCIDAKPVTRGEHGRVLLKEISEMLQAKSVGGDVCLGGA